MGAKGGIDAHRPKAAKIILFVASVGKRVEAGMNNRRIGSPLLVAEVAAIALGQGKGIAAGLILYRSSFNAGHSLKLRVLFALEHQGADLGAELHVLSALAVKLALAGLFAVKVVAAGLAGHQFAVFGHFDALAV